ncbi:MAG TPA: AAA family ATPase [Gammaproteobacteria bacterium]|jgi:MoxR-like ATPase|nr:AAA family ATPase [Gammaproteobacteria bacterium]|tara:strand:+ start:6214 stop:7269 length:1056 start_codon:yes stop_codon:yes gene_type:complete
MTSDSTAEITELSSVDGSDALSATNTDLSTSLGVLQTLMNTVKKQVLGRDDVIELAIIALLADGHILLEDYPGSGKTTLAKALGDAIVSGTSTDEAIVPFRRIQFTPDLLPSDVTGVPVFDSNSNAFHFRHGPLFAHVVLADEINRTSPKVQSAMLEAMGEKQVTVDNVTYALDGLFFVIATQNPLDLVGTYPLPTPQLDRFLFKITMNHIDREAELDVLDTYKERRDFGDSLATVTRDEVLSARHEIDSGVSINPAIKTVLVDISRNLRSDDRVLQGNSTRSMVLLLPALQVSAALRGRNYVSAEDIELLLPRILGHRIELAPGVADFEKVLADNMRDPMEQLARSTLTA